MNGREPSSSASPDRPVPEGTGPDWTAIARLVAGEPAANADERAREDAARAWLAARPDEAARVAALGRVLTPSALADVSRAEGADGSGRVVDVEAALARVRRAALLDRAPAATAARESTGPQIAIPQLTGSQLTGSQLTGPQLTVVRGGAPRPPASEPARATPRQLVMPRPVPAWRRAAGLVAAAAMLTAGLAWWRTGGRVGRTLTDSGAGGTTVAQHVVTAVGERRVLPLADGSAVVLGPASTLDVPAGYGGAARRVHLTGEAYFRVVHDDQRPFEVAAGDAIVHDVGTAFVVRAGGTPGQPVDVAVTTGVVRLQAAGPASPGTERDGVLLRAGDRGRVAAATSGAPAAAAVVARGADVGSDTAWTTGHLVFRDAPLGDVAGALRRWYGIDLRFADSAVAQRHLTATFAGESTGAVLHVIELATGARLDRHGDTVVVREAAPSH